MRIVSGKYKRTKLSIPDIKNTRPTTDKVRESIFNIIGPYFDGESVLDLFAGSGAMGMETISRGAKDCIFIDNNREAIDVIKRNLKYLNENQTVIRSDYITALEKIKDRKFDIIFLDPPYDNITSYEYVINFLINNKMLNESAIIVCEHKSEIVINSELDMIKNKQYGKSTITIYEV